MAAARVRPAAGTEAEAEAEAGREYHVFGRVIYDEILRFCRKREYVSGKMKRQRLPQTLPPSLQLKDRNQASWDLPRYREAELK